MATDLFVRFSTIEEKSPAYLREYDFFISKFSAMCHANRGTCIKERRYNGLRGIRGELEFVEHVDSIFFKASYGSLLAMKCKRTCGSGSI